MGRHHHSHGCVQRVHPLLPGGRLRTGGFKGGDDQIKIVSLKGGSKAVKYGDSIALMGQNGKYFMVRYSGVVTARTSVLAADTTFKILGGSGPVMVGDRPRLSPSSASSRERRLAFARLSRM